MVLIVTCIICAIYYFYKKKFKNNPFKNAITAIQMQTQTTSSNKNDIKDVIDCQFTNAINNNEINLQNDNNNNANIKNNNQETSNNVHGSAV